MTNGKPDFASQNLERQASADPAEHGPHRNSLRPSLQVAGHAADVPMADAHNRGKVTRTGSYCCRRHALRFGEPSNDELDALPAQCPRARLNGELGRVDLGEPIVRLTNKPRPRARANPLVKALVFSAIGTLVYVLVVLTLEAVR